MQKMEIESRKGKEMRMKLKTKLYDRLPIFSSFSELHCAVAVHVHIQLQEVKSVLVLQLAIHRIINVVVLGAH